MACAISKWKSNNNNQKEEDEEKKSDKKTKKKEEEEIQGIKRTRRRWIGRSKLMQQQCYVGHENESILIKTHMICDCVGVVVGWLVGS